MNPASPTLSVTAQRWRAFLLAMAVLVGGGTNVVELATSMQPDFFARHALVGLQGMPEGGALRVTGDGSIGSTGIDRRGDQNLAQVKLDDLVTWNSPASSTWTSVFKFPSATLRSDEVDLTVKRGSQTFALRVHPVVPITGAELTNFYGQIISDVIFALVGALLVYRRPDLVAVRALSFALICWSSCIPMVSTGIWFDLLYAINKLTARMWFSVMLVYWAIHLAEHSPWRLTHWLRRVWPLWATVSVALSLLVSYSAMVPTSLEAKALFNAGQYNLILTYAMVTLGLIEGVAASTGEARTRIKWALFIFGLNFIIFPFRFLTSEGLAEGYYFQTGTMLVIFDYMLQLVLPLGLLYATLRHRLVDLGFVIHRGLVYAGVSSLLVLSFAGLERLSGYFFHAQNQQESALRSALIALAIFLFFHKMRSWVNASVEYVFFSSWKARDEAIRSFVKKAVHITEMAPLIEATIDQLDRFAAPATSAIYRVGEDGHYHRVGGSLAEAPATINANAPFAVSMRYDGQPDATAAIHQPALSVLAVPMMYRGRLDGFVLLHRTGGDEAFRPDQLKMLSEVVREVGFDLAALEIDQYKRHGQELEQDMRVLRGQADELRAIVQAATRPVAVS